MDAQLSKKTRHHATKPNQSWIGFTPNMSQCSNGQENLLTESYWKFTDTDQKKVPTSNPTTLDELKQIIKEIWCTDNDQNVCKNLTDSMPSRIQKINKGYHTKY